MSGDPCNVCFWVAKLEMSHVLQSNSNKSYRGPGVISLYKTHWKQNDFCCQNERELKHAMTSSYTRERYDTPLHDRLNNHFQAGGSCAFIPIILSRLNRTSVIKDDRKVDIGNRYLSAKTKNETVKFFTSLHGKKLVRYISKYIFSLSYHTVDANLTLTYKWYFSLFCLLVRIDRYRYFITGRKGSTVFL